MPIDLLQYGGVGLAAWVMWLYYKNTTNHSHDLTLAIKDNTKALQELKEAVLKVIKK